jgi:hypothetical protein
VTENSDALASAFGGGTWTLLSARGNDVYVDGERLAKVAKNPDGFKGLKNGVAMAIVLHDVGVPVVLPLLDAVKETAIGPASLWPLVEHTSVSAAEMNEEFASVLGTSLRMIANADLGTPDPYHPLTRGYDRLKSSSFYGPLLNRTHRLLDLVTPVETRVTTGSRSLAHGDAAVSNCLCLADGSVLLIDLDQSGWRPEHWDVATAYNNLVLESGNIAAFDALRTSAGYDEVSSELMDAALVKATLTTTFGLTFDPTRERVAMMNERVDAMLRWANGEAPLRLPGWW